MSTVGVSRFESEGLEQFSTFNPPYYPPLTPGAPLGIGTLVSIHLPSTNNYYIEAVRVSYYFQSFGFPDIRCDYDHYIIHFGYDLATVRVLFKMIPSGVSAHIVKAMERPRGRAIVKTTRGTILELTKSHINFELHTRYHFKHLEIAEQFAMSRNVDRRIKKWVVAHARFSGKSFTPKEIDREKENFIQDAPTLLQSLARDYLALSSQSPRQYNERTYRIEAESKQKRAKESDEQDDQTLDPAFLRTHGGLTRTHALLTESTMIQLREHAREGVELVRALQNISCVKCHTMVIHSMEDREGTRKLLYSLLEGAPGICFAEGHDRGDTVEFMIRYMRDLFDRGVRKLYLEGLDSELCQSWLDQYFSDQNTPMPPQLEKVLRLKQELPRRKITPYTKLKLVQAAKTAGIRVLGIETLAARHAHDLNRLTKHCKDSYFRTLIMNHTATEIVANSLKGKEKFILLAGAAHIADLNNGKILGLSTLLGCPSIGVGRSIKQFVKVFEKDLSLNGKKNDGIDYFFKPNRKPILLNRKIKIVDNRIKELERLTAKTNKAARSAKQGRLVQLTQLKEKQQRLLQERAILQDVF